MNPSCPSLNSNHGAYVVLNLFHAQESLMLMLNEQPCPIFCYPTDCSPSGSSVYGILQARKLEWIAILFSMGSSQLRD